MKNLQRALENGVFFFIGVAISSGINNTDDWKFYIPMMSICFIFRIVISEKQ